MAGRAEGVDDLLAHLAAAGPEAGSDRRDEVAGVGPELPFQPHDRLEADSLHRAAPAGMNGGNGTGPAFGNQYGRAVRDADAQRRGGVGADDAVGPRRHPAPCLARRRYRNRGSVDLVQQTKLRAGDTGERRDRVPFRVVGTELDRSGGEEVVRDVEQRQALQDRAPRRLRPREAVARLGQRHEHHRNRT